MSEKKPAFAGFQPSNTTPVPDVFFDELMADLSNAELRVMLYIFRRTWGFKKDTDAISFNQFLKGITTKDGRVLDKGCGVTSRGALSKALKGLEERGCIITKKGRDPLGENQTTLYSIRFVSNVAANEPQGGSAKNELPVVPKSNHRGSKNEPPVVPKMNQQERERQETVKQQTVIQERKKEPALQQQETSALSIDQQIWFDSVYCQSKIGVTTPDVIDEIFKKHLVAIMKHAKTVDELNSLYDHVKRKIAEEGLKDHTVYPGNLANKRYLAGWIQAKERPVNMSLSSDQSIEALPVNELTTVRKKVGRVRPARTENYGWTNGDC